MALVGALIFMYILLPFIFRAGGNNYRRVRNSMPTNDMGGERGEDGEDEETLYDRTESTSQF